MVVVCVEQGFGPTALRSVSFWGIYYSTYEWTTSWFNGLTEVGFNGVGSARQSSIVLTAGALAGALSWWVVLPIDLIKTKIQGQSFDRPPVYSSSLDCIRKVRLPTHPLLGPNVGGSLIQLRLLQGLCVCALPILLILLILLIS